MNIITAPQPASNAPPPQTVNKGKPTLNSDFETFLKMLTAQMKNQDPLNPIDSSEYASQLASFSSVEQQVLTNDLLTNLSAQMNVMGMSQLAGWVGMEARSSAPVHFNGSPVSLMPTAMPLAEKSFLVVRDGTGDIVQRAEMPGGSKQIDWAGVDDSGRPFPSGL